jgi:hypothetical protein
VCAEPASRFEQETTDESRREIVRQPHVVLPDGINAHRCLEKGFEPQSIRPVAELRTSFVDPGITESRHVRDAPASFQSLQNLPCHQIGALGQRN